MNKSELKLLNKIREGLVKANNNCVFAVSTAPFKTAIAQIDALKIMGECDDDE